MDNLPRLSFPLFTFRVNRDKVSGDMRIWDDIRGIWLILTPEEWVRQHLIRFLINDCGAFKHRISQEYPVSVQGMSQRADVVVFGSDGRPLLLAECKSYMVEIDASVYAQAVRYNCVVGARYLLITNGMSNYIYEKDEKDNYSSLDRFPPLG